MANKKRDKRIKKYLNFIYFYAVITMTIFIGYTFSRYVATAESNENIIGLAKFNVEVNGVAIKSDNPFNLKLSPNANTYNNKIAPDVENGYFEIVIDPTGTEVSLEYNFKFDLENISKNISLTKYTINDEEQHDITDNTIIGQILLPDSSKGFESQHIVDIKVYWRWAEDIVNPIITDENATINVSSIIRQKID